MYWGDDMDIWFDLLTFHVWSDERNSGLAIHLFLFTDLLGLVRSRALLSFELCTEKPYIDICRLWRKNHGIKNI